MRLLIVEDEPRMAALLRRGFVEDGQAAITGDFAMVPDEVQGVLGALRTSGIEVTALHSHMLMATSPG